MPTAHVPFSMIYATINAQSSCIYVGHLRPGIKKIIIAPSPVKPPADERGRVNSIGFKI